MTMKPPTRPSTRPGPESAAVKAQRAVVDKLAAQYDAALSQRGAITDDGAALDELSSRLFAARKQLTTLLKRP